MDPDALIARTAKFAIDVIALCETIPDRLATRRIKSQLVDAATSVAGNYRATCRARTKAEFVAKIGVVREEADEAYGWLLMLVEVKGLSEQKAKPLVDEAWELTAIFNASYLTATRGRQRRKPSRPDVNP